MYSTYRGFINGPSEGPWFCGLDDKPIKQIEGVCPMFEESSISKIVSEANLSGQTQSDDYIPELPEDVENWALAHRGNKALGVKYDDNKPRLAEMIQDFSAPLEALCATWEYGADKYTETNWKYVLDGERRYTNALVRHLVAEDKEPYDKESHLLHAAHVAFNAIARLHFILKNYEVKSNDD